MDPTRPSQQTRLYRDCCSRTWWCTYPLKPDGPLEAGQPCPVSTIQSSAVPPVSSKVFALPPIMDHNARNLSNHVKSSSDLLAGVILIPSLLKLYLRYTRRNQLWPLIPESGAFPAGLLLGHTLFAVFMFLYVLLRYRVVPLANYLAIDRHLDQCLAEKVGMCLGHFMNAHLLTDDSHHIVLMDAPCRSRKWRTCLQGHWLWCGRCGAHTSRSRYVIIRLVMPWFLAALFVGCLWSRYV